jgi:hypothetical protein
LSKRLLQMLFAAWIVRWAAGELAAYAGRRLLPPGPPPIESAQPPGWMPGPRADRS